MTALLPFLVPLCLGSLALTVLLRAVPVRQKGLLLAAASLPTGLGICSTILFLALWFTPTHVKLFSMTTAIMAILIFIGLLFFSSPKKKTSHALSRSFHDLKLFFQRLFENMFERKKNLLKLAGQSLSILIFLWTLWTIIQFFTLSVSTNITGGWDARYMWSLKAKFMFRSPADWQTMFSQQLSWCHADYPLLWPGTLAWGWYCLGKESLLWPPWASLCFYISCSFIVVWYLAVYVSKITGWIAGTFFFILTPPLFWSIHQYADMPLTFFMTASALTLAAAFREAQPRLFVISGFMAGLAAWTKNEGVLFLLWISLLLIGLKFLKKRSHSAVLHAGKSFLAGAFLPLLWLMAFKVFFGRNGDYFGPERFAQDYVELILRGWKNGPIIFQAYWDQISRFALWKGLWAFFGSACIALFFKKRRDGYAGVFPSLILLINLAYMLAFLTTPNDLQWHLRMALERLLIHSAPLALVFSFEILTCRRNDFQKT